VPHCFPAQPDFPEERRAERVVWEALRDQLPDEAALFHSLQVKEGGNDYEADLVVVWPGVGIGVIEVKGGQVSYAGGQWSQSGGAAGAHKIVDPVVQAQDACHVLHRFIAPRTTEGARARRAHLVAFPYTQVPSGWSTPGCPRELVIDSSDLRSAASIVKTVIESHGAGHAPLSEDGATYVIEALTSQLGGQLSLLSIAEEHEHRVDQMTRDQAMILRVLRHHTRLKVIGGAGSGKTWLALEQASRLASAGQRVALLCYLRGLARYFERVVATWPADQRPAYVGMFHGLPLLWGAPPPLEDKSAEVQSVYYEESLPTAMAELAAALPESERFDSVIIDEAQDFGEAWWTATLACLRDRDSGGLFAFLDEAQRVFNRYGEVPIPLAPIHLSDNLRNTKRIAQTFGSLVGEQMRYLGLDGPPVRFVQCATDEALAAADAEVDRLVDEGWPQGQIALLTTGRRHEMQVELAETYGDPASYWDEFFAEESVFYGHVLGFKGLERNVVVLAVNGIRDTERAKEYLYVGMSRARTQLVVCGDLDTIEQYGGTALQKRLQSALVR
jgi:ATP:corrinoid adenosyltransferase